MIGWGLAAALIGVLLLMAGVFFALGLSCGKERWRNQGLTQGRLEGYDVGAAAGYRAGVEAMRPRKFQEVGRREEVTAQDIKPEWLSRETGR